VVPLQRTLLIHAKVGVCLKMDPPNMGTRTKLLPTEIFCLYTPEEVPLAARLAGARALEGSISGLPLFCPFAVPELSDRVFRFCFSDMVLEEVRMKKCCVAVLVP
jgi:hypothetical protein